MRLPLSTPPTMRHEIDPVHCAATKIAFRRAAVADIPALLVIEELCFPTDRMTRRNFRYAIVQAKGVVLVATVDGEVAGYGVLGFHARTRIGRLTSFALHPDHRGAGIGRRLLAALEDAAAAHGCGSIRLEVRRDNAAAIGLYNGAGYALFGVYHDYYEDDMAALRLEKPLAA
ncbi:GNAT family N-acetyltransferase [Azospirillum doebereinerae]